MSNKTERLTSLNNDKLIDVVKNYRQYGYDDGIRTTAIEILKERGIDKEQLQLTGNFQNETYNSAKEIYNLFKQNSKVAFIFYGLILITSIIIPISAKNLGSFTLIVEIISWISIAVYFIYLLKSFLNHNDFFKRIGKDFGNEGILIYFFLGMPFYIFMYFYFRNQMNGAMKLIK
ncbi:MAG TPA: hypothetical protein ENK46_15100 [Flavobacteriia bacterium]|nr:hypothetical protein [Flavobacteriia bacterium]